MRSNHLRVILLFFLFLLYNTSFSQISKGGLPYTLKDKESSKNNNGINNSRPLNHPSKKLILNAIDNKQEIERANELKNSCSNCKQEYYGTGINIEINLKKDGEKLETRDGTIWLYEITSNQAYGLQLYFEHYSVPEGSELFIYTPDYEQILGAFTKDNNSFDNRFATQVLPGESAIIEYFEPKKVEFNGELIISKIIHSFKPYFEKNENGTKNGGNGSSGSCTIDANCTAASDFQNEKQSTLRISFYDFFNNFTFWCSGSLINSTHGDRQGYVLTAEHCVSSNFTMPQYDPNTVFEFNRESTTCNSTNSKTPKSITGAYLETKGTTSDYALFRLSSPPPLSYFPVYLGWDSRSTLNPNSTVSIHHPSGDFKKFSRDNNPPIKVRMEKIEDGYSEANGGFPSHWKVNWSVGVTEGGSSGAFLIDANSKRLVGILSNGSSRCMDSPNLPGTGFNSGPDYYGLLSYSWNNSDIGFPYLKNFLDHNNQGVQTLNSHIPSYPSHCYDGIKSGNETGIDCGGACPSCGGNTCNISPGEITLEGSCYSTEVQPVVKAKFTSNCELDLIEIRDIEYSNIIVFQRFKDKDCYYTNGVFGCHTRQNGNNVSLLDIPLDYRWLNSLPSFPDTRTFSFFARVQNSDIGRSEVRTFTIYRPPRLSAGENKSICINETTTIGTESTQGMNFIWQAVTPSNALSFLDNPNKINPTFTGSLGGNFTYKLISVDPTTQCRESSQTTITVKAIAGEQNSTYSVAMGSIINSIGVKGYNGSPGDQIIWSPQEHLSSSTASNPQFTAPYNPGMHIYNVQITNSTGCTETKLVSVEVSNSFPSNLLAETLSDHEIKLTWKNNSNTASSYIVERSEVPNWGVEQRAVLPGNTATFIDIVAPRTQYHYRVRNIESQSEKSGFSNFSSATSFVAKNKTLGGTGDDKLVDILDVPDGYILAGTTSSPAGGDISDDPRGNISFRDIWIIKVDKNLNKIWDKRYGGNGDVDLKKIIPNGEGGFYIGSTIGNFNSGWDISEPPRGGKDYWLLKINSSGNKIWDRRFGGAQDDDLVDIVLHGTNCFLAGNSLSNTGGDKTHNSYGSSDYWIVNVLSNGTKSWDVTLGGSGEEILHSAILYNNRTTFLSLGGYTSSNVVSGTKSIAGTGYYQVILNTSGNRHSDKIYSFFDSENTKPILRRTSSIMRKDSFDKIYVLYDKYILNLDTPGSSFSIEENGTDFLIDESGNFIIKSHYLYGYNTCGIKLHSLGMFSRSPDRLFFDDAGGGTWNEQTKRIEWVHINGPIKMILEKNGTIAFAITSSGNIGGDKSESSKGGNDFLIYKWPRITALSKNDGLGMLASNFNNLDNHLLAKKIIIPYESSSSILESGSKVKVEGVQIRLLPGFHAKQGALFIAKPTVERSLFNQIPCLNSREHFVEENKQSKYEEPSDMNGLLETQKNKKLVIHLYPNPTKSIINISTNSFESDNVEMEITNASGTRIQYKTFIHITSLNEAIDFKKYAKGVYFLKIIKREGVYVNKIIYQ